MPFQRLLCHRIPPRAFLGRSYTFLRGKVLVWKRCFSQRLPGSAHCDCFRRNPSGFHRSCTEQEMPYPFMVRLSLFAVRHCWRVSWGSQENCWHPSRRSRQPCPDSLPGVFILTAKVASLFVRTFSHGCFACPHRRTHHVRRRSASVTFRGAGACPSSRVRDVGHPVRGGAGPRRPQARRRVYLRDHQRQVRALP